MIDRKPFWGLSVNSVLMISVNGPRWGSSDIQREDLESVMKEPKRDEDVMEAYLLTLMGFDIARVKSAEYIVFLMGDEKYDLSFHYLK